VVGRFGRRVLRRGAETIVSGRFFFFVTFPAFFFFDCFPVPWLRATFFRLPGLRFSPKPVELLPPRLDGGSLAREGVGEAGEGIGASGIGAFLRPPRRGFALYCARSAALVGRIFGISIA
jgi:hypothetical protein